MDNLERIIDTAIRNGINIGCVRTMESLGVTSAELSERQAVKTYGAWLTEAIRKGSIHPCRVGNGKTGTRWYRVSDILTYKTQKEIKALIIL